MNETEYTFLTTLERHLTETSQACAESQKDLAKVLDSGITTALTIIKDRKATIEDNK